MDKASKTFCSAEDIQPELELDPRFKTDGEFARGRQARLLSNDVTLKQCSEETPRPHLILFSKPATTTIKHWYLGHHGRAVYLALPLTAGSHIESGQTSILVGPQGDDYSLSRQEPL